MKKLVIGFLSLFLLSQAALAQPVNDNAIIPMGITVQSIMRLNIKRGGNIEFVFSKIADIKNGIVNAPNYDTYFDVAASQNWRLELGTDVATFLSDDGTPLPLNTVELNVLPVATKNTTILAAYAGANYGVLPIAPLNLLDWSTVDTNVGDAAENDYIIHWRCGVTNKVSGYPAGRYTVNVYLSLLQH